MNEAVRSANFYLRVAVFGIRERFSDLAAGIAGFLIFPFFIWIISRVWQHYNSYQGHYTLAEVLTYIACTEILFMTFFQMDALTRAAGDFSISLARPRSWLAMSFATSYGRSLGSKVIFGAISAICLPLLGVPWELALTAVARTLALAPLLGIPQSLLVTWLSSAKVRWDQISFFILPISKIFLALGGVFGPLDDYGEPFRTTLLALPPSDLFFQPAHFAIRGEFYGISPLEWGVRVTAFSAIAAAALVVFYREARKHHQGYGG